MLTAERLRAVLVYDVATGAFTRGGEPVGGVNAGGYVRVGIDSRQHYAHRLAWLYVYGKWPARNLDHINGRKTDNRIANLREACHALNAHNIFRAQSNSSLGVRGVSRHGNKFTVKIATQGYNKYLGLFATAAQAHEAYLAAKLDILKKG